MSHTPATLRRNEPIHPPTTLYYSNTAKRINSTPATHHRRNETIQPPTALYNSGTAVRINSSAVTPKKRSTLPPTTSGTLNYAIAGPVYVAGKKKKTKNPWTQDS